MNTKLIFYGCLAIGLLPTLSGLGGLKNEQQERSSVQAERRALEREATNALRDSQLALKWARRCVPVLDLATRKEFPLSPGMRFVTEDGRIVIQGNRIVCNSMGDVAEVEDGFVTRVITIDSENREEYARIFNTLRPSQVDVQPDVDPIENQESNQEHPWVEPPPPNPYQ